MHLDSSNLLSVVVRYHDKGNRDFLYEAMGSIVKQTYPNIEILLCTQNVSASSLEEISSVTKTIIQKTPADHTRVFRTFNEVCEPDEDIRSKLFLKGILNAQGAYLAFLDYDDVMFDYAYSLLIELLPKDESVALIAGGINRSIRLNLNGIEKCVNSQPFIKRKHLTHELCHHNFLPLHSYMIKTANLRDLPLQTSIEKLWMFEDYALLLLLASRYKFELSHFEIPVGEYRFRPQIPNSTLQIKSNDRIRKQWTDSYEIVEALKGKIPYHATIGDLKDAIHFERTHHFNSLSYDFFDF